MSTSHPHRAAVALGSNLGDRAASIAAAVKCLAGDPRVRLEAASENVETEPAGPIPQGRYLNAAVVLCTCLKPRALLDLLLTIEQRLGRDRARQQRWGPRTIDLDLILYDDRQINEPDLVVPHPRLRQRRFVLDPLAQIAPSWPVPPDGRTVRELRALCTGSAHTGGAPARAEGPGGSV